MGRPQVSIIMSSYNPRDRKCLFGSIGSLLDQTLREWELILCDDGSDASGAALLREAALLDQRIRLIRVERNRGLAHGLNCCLECASGEFIARMDDDDLSDAERLQKQVLYLRQHPQADWLGCRAWLFDDDGVWGVHDAPSEPTAADFLPFSPFIHPSVMFRAEALRRAGGYLDRPLTRRCEDYELFMRMSAMGMHGHNLKEKLLCYREPRNRVTRRTLKNCWREMIVRFRGFRSLGISPVRAVPAALKPIVVWVVSFFPHLAQGLRKCCSGGILDAKTGRGSNDE